MVPNPASTPVYAPEENESPNEMQQQQQPGQNEPEAQSPASQYHPYQIQPQHDTQQQSPSGDANDQQAQGVAAVDPIPPAAVIQDPSPTTIQLGPQPGLGPTTINIAASLDPEAINYIAPTPLVEPLTNPNAQSQAQAQPQDLKPAPGPPIITVAGQTLTITNPSALPIAGTVLTPGGPGITIANTPISLVSGPRLVIGAAAPLPTSRILTIAGQMVVANPTSFEIGGTPVTAGGSTVTVGGTPVSLGTNGNLVIGGNTDGQSPPVANVITVGDQTITANPTGFTIAGSTIAIGGPVVSIQGTPISLGSSGILIIGSITTTLAPTTPDPEPFVLTVGNQQITADPSSVVFGGTTLSAGASGVIIDDTLVSLNPSGSLVLGSSTIPLAPSPLPLLPAESKVRVAGQIFTALGNNEIAIDGATVTSGEAMTIISGIPMKIGPGGLEVGNVTVSLPDNEGAIDTASASFSGGITASASASASASYSAAASFTAALTASPSLTGSGVKHSATHTEKGGAIRMGAVGLLETWTVVAGSMMLHLW